MNDMFDEKDIETIKAAKAHIESKLFDFNLTAHKLGVKYMLSYFVSGGCIASLIQGEQPKDYDIYFFSEDIAAPIINLYKNDPSYQNEVAVYDEKYRDVITADKRLITENAITLKNGLQLITKHYGEPDDVRNTFDFIHCKPYYDSRNNQLYISPDQFYCCKNKILKTTKDYVDPNRMNKFQKRGYLVV